MGNNTGMLSEAENAARGSPGKWDGYPICVFGPQNRPSAAVGYSGKSGAPS
jgi:hypothetical protein